MYDPAPYQAGQNRPVPYEPVSDPAPYRQAPSGQAPYADDPRHPETFGDLFAGGGRETGSFPARPAPAPEADGEWDDTASRLLYPQPGPPRRPRGRRAQIISAALGLAALLVGGVTAWTAFGHHPGARLAGRQTTATRPPSPTPRGRAAPSASPQMPTSPAPSALTSPSPSVPAPGGAAAVVTMAPGLSQAPDAAQVDGFLVSYFTAINAHDYQQYARLLIPGRRARLSAAAFAQGYGTTTDAGASIVGISPTRRGVAATVAFTSQQRSAAGADVTGCTYWDITLYLQKQEGALLIGNPPAGYHAYHRSCP